MIRFAACVVVAMWAVLVAGLAACAGESLSVRDFGAVGDGLADETAAFNQAIAAGVQAGQPVFVPTGDYRINPEIGIKLLSGSKLAMAPKAVLRAIATSSGHSRLIQIYNCRGASVSGGQLIGERESHLGAGGEWGMGLDIRGSSDVAVVGVQVSECWGDGVYISGCSNVLIAEVKLSHNRRQGLSIVDGSKIVIRNCVFERTEGTLPSCGIAIETNEGQSVRDVKITSCRCVSNAGRGISVSVPNQFVGAAVVEGVQIDNCEISSNGCDSPAYGVEISNASQVRVRNCKIEGNRGIGIGSVKVRRVSVMNCTVTGTIPIEGQSIAGVLFSEDLESELIGCRIVDNETPGIFLHKSSVVARSNRIVRNRTRQ